MGKLLIPFGIHRKTGAIIEPEDACSGRACACLCPGCKAPLLSRHPKEKRYHFAHDSRHEDAKPEEECPFSSAVAVAMMAREVVVQTIGKILETPTHTVSEKYSCCGLSNHITVTSESRNTIDQVKVNVKAFEHNVDLLLEVSGYQILVDLVYKGKPPISVDEEKLQINKAALLALDCDSFSSLALKNNRELRFSEAVIAFILKEGHREWRFHPRTANVLSKVRQEHQCTNLMSSVFNMNSRENYQSRAQPLSNRAKVKRKPVRYKCLMCEIDCLDDSGDSFLQCPKCHKHLFLRKIS